MFATMPDNAIHLMTNSTQMSFFIDEKGHPRRAYYGVRLQTPVDAVADMACEPSNTLTNSAAPLVYSTLADSLANWQNATDEYDIAVTQADGTLSLELVCESHQLITLDDDRTEVIFHLHDPAYPVRVDVHVRAHRASDVFMQWAVIRHVGSEPIQLRRADSGHLWMKAERYFITGFRGSWGGESRLSEAELALGHEISLASNTCTRAAQEGSPSFIIAANDPAREDDGELILGTLGWSGSYDIRLRHSPYHYLYAGAGINLSMAPYVLDGGQDFTTPPLILAHSMQGKGEATRRLHRWARRYGIRDCDRERLTLLNSWEGVYFNFTEELLHGMMQRTADLGLELFVLDDGWFGREFPRNHDSAGLGDWMVNAVKLPNGIKGLTRKAAELGIKFGIWIEPEMVNPQSELYRAHPEWVIGLPRRDNKTERNQFLLDLGNPRVQDYVLDVMRDLLGNNPGISYIKWDCNRKVSDPGCTHLDATRQGNLAVDYVRGYHAVLDALIAEFPHVTFQACSSGGGRTDYGTMSRHHEFWTSDNTDAVERVYMQWGIGHVFPAIAMAAHVTASPNHQTGRATPLKFRFDVAMSGRLGFELQPCDMTPAELEYSKCALAEYKRIRPVVQFGELYRLSSPYESRVASLMYTHENRAIVFAWQMDKWRTDAAPALKLKGLKPHARYLIRELNVDEAGLVTRMHEQTRGGDYLMNAGIRMGWKKALQSVCLELVEVE